VVTYQNTTVPDVIVHTAAETLPISVRRPPTGSSADHVTSDYVTPPVQWSDGVDRGPPPAAGVWVTPVSDGQTLSAHGSGGSCSLPQLSLASGRQQSTLYRTGSNNLSLSALHAATHVDAVSERQTLIRSRTCRPCHDLSRVSVDRPRCGSHFRLSAAVADLATSSEKIRDRSNPLQSVVICDPAHRPDNDAGHSVELFRTQAAVDGEAMTGRSVVGRGGLAVLGGVRAWWSKSEETTQSCAESWREKFTCRRRSAEEEISFALTHVSLVSLYFMLRHAASGREQCPRQGWK